jgi:hypothetical protein
VSRALAFATVLLVDDRSTDGSAELARSLGAEALPSTRPGYDGALDTGLRSALMRGFDYVVTLDADGEHDPGKLAGFIALFEAGETLVCGVRPTPQRAAEHLAAWAGGVLLGIHDPLCGMKGYARPVLEAYAASGAPLPGQHGSGRAVAPRGWGGRQPAHRRRAPGRAAAVRPCAEGQLDHPAGVRRGAEAQGRKRMKLLTILQARMTSTRLPGKVLKPVLACR